MSVPVCPKDYILVEIDSKFKDTTSGGLIVDTSWKPGEYATVCGKVASTPLGLTNHPEKRVIAPEVEVGDELAFSYTVVFSRSYIDNKEDVFSEEASDDPFVTTWMNNSGVVIMRRNLMGGKFEIVVFQVHDGNREVTFYEKGDKNRINHLVEKFKVEKSDIIHYENVLQFDGKDYWKVDYPAAFAVKRGDEIKMIGGYVLLEHKEVNRQSYSGKLELWGDYRRDESKEIRSKVISVNPNFKSKYSFDVKAGDEVIVNKDTIQEYEFWGQKYLLARKNQLIAKVA